MCFTGSFPRGVGWLLYQARMGGWGLVWLLCEFIGLNTGISLGSSGLGHGSKVLMLEDGW